MASKSELLFSKLLELEARLDELETIEFARKRGSRDKKKRKRKGMSTAAKVGLGAAGVVGGAAALRYGGAAAKTALAQRRLYNGPAAMGKKANRVGGWKDMKMGVNTGRDAASGGARGQLGRDVQAVKNFGSKVKSRFAKKKGS